MPVKSQNFIKQDKGVGAGITPLYHVENERTAAAEEIPMSTDQKPRDPEKSIRGKPMPGSLISVGDEKKRNFLDTTSLIRSIQRSEGNPDCFLKEEAVCDRTDCSWRLYCIGKEPQY